MKRINQLSRIRTIDRNQHPSPRRIDKFNYTILAPKKFRVHTDYVLSLTIHDAEPNFDEAVFVRVSIEDKHDKARFSVHRNIAMNPNVTELVSISIGDVPAGRRYKLVAKGISGTDMNHEADLHLQTDKYIIFIQTDKAIYKPMDCVKFRVLVLDRDLKAAPIAKNELIIEITDSCGYLLKKWNGVNTNSGVFSDEYQLSDLVSLGRWEIKASVCDQVKIIPFEVDEYVLPKFEVEVSTPGYFMPEDKKAHVVVQAKYTHGKPLKGTVAVTVSGFVDIKKTAPIDGQKTIEFDIEKELEFNTHHFKYYDVKAVVTENLTGLSRSGKVRFTIDTQYVVRISPENHVNFKQGSTNKLKVSVRKRNGSVPSFDDSIKRQITIDRERFYSTNKPSSKIKAVHQLDENGNAMLIVDVDGNETAFSLKAIYASTVTNLGKFSTYTDVSTSKAVIPVSSKPTDELRLETEDLKKKYKINEPVVMEVLSNEPIPSYTYVIVSRGKILESKTVQPIFDDSYTTLFVHRFSFHPHFGYAPKVDVFVYCVVDGKMAITSFSIDLSDDFANFIDLDISQDVARPGDLVNIKVKSNKNSYIGLLGVDQSVLSLGGDNDLAREDIWKELRVGHRNLSYVIPGLILFSNVHLRVLKPEIDKESTLHLVLRLRGGGGGPGVVVTKLTEVRKFFPETWIWDSIDSKNFDGSATLERKVPDSLTTWVLNGFSIDPVNGLALIKAPLKLRVQQEFYITMNLPYSVKRGEIVTIPCSIFNHLAKDVEVQVTLDNENDEFHFVDAPTGRHISKRKKVNFWTQKLTIPSEDAKNASFAIRPTKVGSISLKVKAVSPTVSDCVIHTLNVECEGVPQYVNKSVLIDLRNKSQTGSVDLIVDMPENVLPDSERIEVNCIGDLLGGTIKNLQKLIRLPYGCGEQTMLTFVPNIVVLNYLKNTHQLTDKIDAKVKKYLELGYQRELRFKHGNGSFSAFGMQYDASGSTWLTAFVARSFQQASKHILIQQHIIDKALKWLSETQAQNGSFIEKGRIIHKEMQGGAANGLALTAYVLTAFLVNESLKNVYRATIGKAIDHIVKSVKNCADVYTLGVCAYALQLAGHSSSRQILDRLNDAAKRNRTHKWWEKSNKMNEKHSKESKTVNVEITSYALLTLLQNVEDDVDDVLPTVKWLLNQRNDRGGFEGTQDTILGIEALANFALMTNSSGKNEVNIGIRTSHGEKFTFDVHKDNSLMLQSQKLNRDTKWVSVNATGNGFSLVELSYRYNINAPIAQSAFSLKPRGVLVDENMSLDVTVNYDPPTTNSSFQRSNMAIAEVSLPSGFVLDIENLNSLTKTIPRIKKTETKNDDTVAVIYFEYLDSKPVGLKIFGSRKHVVTDRRPSPIIIYDYYDNAFSAREFYSLAV